MSAPLTLGYSPCPNDTFIFHALTHGKVPTGGLRFDLRHEDVETLNNMARSGALDITKVSYGAIAELMDTYCLLRSGGALGRGCGPLLVARSSTDIASLRGRPIAVPGLNTTALLLLRLYDPDLAQNIIPMPFERIMPSVADGSVDAGLVIHEGRFTYKAHGLIEIIDLGKWWEQTTGHPIPLGCIIARRTLGSDIIRHVETLIRQSILHARAHPADSAAYIKAHSQELADDVIEKHIALYVNDYSLDIGPDGEQAIRALFDMAAERGIIARTEKSIFADQGSI